MADKSKIDDLFIVLILATQTKYGDRPLNEVMMDLAPPVLMGQYDIQRRDGEPVSFATWAWLNDDTLKQAMQGRTLMGQEWQSGDIPWIAGFASLVHPIAQFRALQKIFKGKRPLSRRGDWTGSVKAEKGLITEWIGAAA